MAHKPLMDDRVSAYLSDMESVKESFNKFIAASEVATLDRKKLIDISERFSDLIKRYTANLEIENQHRKKAQNELEKSEALFRQFAENINEVFWRTTPKMDSVIYVSPAYEEIWGRSIEAIYKNYNEWFEAVVPEDKTRVEAAFKQLTDAHISTLTIEFRIIRPDTTVRAILTRATLLKDKISGQEIGIIGISTDITELKKSEQDLSIQFQLSKAALKEKEAMLKEIYHRVKNNLQVVSSLLNLQARSIADPDSKKIFIESSARVKAMALVHEMLYRSGDLSQIKVNDYVKKLADNLVDIYHIDTSRIKLIFDMDAIRLNIDDAIPCGLIINELLSNVFKHAFQSRESGEVKISFKKQDDKIVLSVADNGVGFPSNLDFHNTKTLGMQLLNSLTKQLSGEVTLSTIGNTTFMVIFKQNQKGE